ncbi:hypothetical protein [Neptuniibacter sp. QD37_11]|uniref:hypothetical protein n=1 Tax=Neptuniibacter sp. QD37_11 TaxID=3398209 RepID=UPI0039F46EE4
MDNPADPKTLGSYGLWNSCETDIPEHGLPVLVRLGNGMMRTARRHQSSDFDYKVDGYQDLRQPTHWIGLDTFHEWKECADYIPEYGLPVLVMLDNGITRVARRYYDGDLDYEVAGCRGLQTPLRWTNLPNQPMLTEQAS